MKTKITPKKTVILIAVILILLFCAAMFIRSCIAIEPDYKYFFISDDLESEKIKTKIYLSAEKCDSLYAEKIGNIGKNDPVEYSDYSIRYGDEVFIPQNIEVVENDGAKIVLCTFDTNEAKRNKLTEYFWEQNYYICIYQQENTGILYCSDTQFLQEYSDKYKYRNGIEKYGNRFMIIPLSENTYFFIATRFVGSGLLGSF